MTRRFAITWDYRCPYARIAHDHVLTGLASGADWDVTFVPFSLGQVHVAAGETDIWDRPGDDSGLLALQAGVAVRDLWPERFLDVHRALFELRHVHGGDLRSREAVGDVLEAHGLEVAKVWAHVDGGEALATIRDEHTQAVADHHVFGVPTFIAGEAAVFVRLLRPAEGDADLAVSTVERVLDNLEWSLLNEFKHTSVPQ